MIGHCDGLGHKVWRWQKGTVAVHLLAAYGWVGQVFWLSIGALKLKSAMNGSCRNWRVSGMRLGCAVNDNTCARLQGSLPAALGDLSELSVLDVQVSLLTGTPTCWAASVILLLLIAAIDAFKHVGMLMQRLWQLRHLLLSAMYILNMGESIYDWPLQNLRHAVY